MSMVNYLNQKANKYGSLAQLYHYLLQFAMSHCFAIVLLSIIVYILQTRGIDTYNMIVQTRWHNNKIITIIIVYVLLIQLFSLRGCLLPDPLSGSYWLIWKASNCAKSLIQQSDYTKIIRTTPTATKARCAKVLSKSQTTTKSLIYFQCNNNEIHW